MITDCEYELVKQAQDYAHKAHDSIGQKRKYDGAPYWTHTDAVAQILQDAGEHFEVVIAGHLHDVKEDVPTSEPMYNCIDETEPFSLTDISDEFGANVANLVYQVTNVFVPKDFPYLSRKLRKQCEAARLASIYADAQTIKYADIIHNLSDWETIFKDDAEYACKYLVEKAEVLDVMKRGNKELKQRAKDIISKHYNYIASN